MAVTQQRMDVERNKELVRRAYDALNRGAIDEFGSFLADDYLEITQEGQTRSKEECLAEFEEIKRAMPDVRYDIQELIAEDDRVVVVENYSGSMRGEMQGIKPTGRRMSVTAVDIYRVRDGKLAEVRSVFDTGQVMQQLGLKE